jgi:hypothetical protein
MMENSPSNFRHRESPPLLVLRRRILQDKTRGRTSAIPAGIDRLETLMGYFGAFLDFVTPSPGFLLFGENGPENRTALTDRVRLSERTIAGLQRVKTHGRVGGRPRTEDGDPRTMANLAALRRSGASIRRIAGELRLSPTTGRTTGQRAGVGYRQW